MLKVRHIVYIFLIGIVIFGCLSIKSARIKGSDNQQTIDSASPQWYVVYKTDLDNISYISSVDGKNKDIFKKNLFGLISQYSLNRKNMLFVLNFGEGYLNNLETYIQIKDIDEGKTIREVKIANTDIKDVVLSPDGQFIAYSSVDYNASSGLPLKQTVHIRSVKSDFDDKELDFTTSNKKHAPDYYKLVGWSNTNKEFIAVAMNDIQGGWQDYGIVGISVSNGQIRDIDVSKEVFVGAKLSSDGKKIAYIPFETTSGNQDWVPYKPYSVKILDMSTGKKETLFESNEVVSQIFWSPFDDRVAIISKGTLSLNIIDLKSKKTTSIDEVLDFGGWVDQSTIAILRRTASKSSGNTFFEDKLVILNLHTGEDIQLEKSNMPNTIRILGTYYQ